jgi:hypothetical protein
VTKSLQNLAKLSPAEKRALLTQLLEEQSNKLHTLPLSYAQQRLWFLHRLEPTSHQYNSSTAFQLSGRLHTESLERSLGEIVRRHEILRTTFPSRHGQPVQTVNEFPNFTLRMEDLSNLSQDDREAEVQRCCAAEFSKPFDLTNRPPFRATLLKLHEEEHLLLITMHHIVTDGWSRGILFRELSELYAAFSAGQPSPLAELPIQYADFAVWQRGWLQGEVLARQLSYWREQLAELPALQLPTDYPRPAVQTFEGAREERVLPKALSERLQELSQREGVTLFMTLLAAFVLLLHRYSGQEDIVVGSPIANRNRSELEGLIGFFVNMLVLRTDLSGKLNFRDLLSRVRERALEAYAHQDLPFEKLVEELQPERDMSRNPLFQVVFALQSSPMAQREIGDLTFSVMLPDTRTTRFDLEVHVREEQEGLEVWFVCNTDLFEAETIRRMLGHYQRLLECMVVDPEQPVSALELLTDVEHHRLLVEWNDTRTEYPREASIAELFEAQAERTPEAVAVAYGESELTYGALNARANQLAHYLRKLGIGPEVMVGICAERSLEMVVGILGILKAGGAYVPLDPDYRKQRLAFMLKDTQAPVLLTQASLKGQLPEYSGRVVCLDADWPEIECEGRANPGVAVGATHLAYVHSPGVCDLHLGFDRRAQGRGGAPPGGGALGS